MYRSLVLWCAPLLLAGCRNSPQMTDPFLPRATVPPPGTGAAAGNVPYYPGGAVAPSAAAPGDGLYTPLDGSYNSAPAGAPTGAPYQGGGGSQPIDSFRMTRGNTTNEQSANQPRTNRQPSSVRSHLAASAAAKNAGDGQDPEVRPAGGEFDAADLGRVVPASHAKIVRVIEPETSADRQDRSPAAADEQEPRRLAAADDAIDIMDLPPARSKGQKSQVSQRVASAPSIPAEADHYGYAPDYRTLRGQLEYSLAERRWKLRYIPIDGDTDSHGGSVVLVDNPPSEFQAGDFVAVAGDLTGDTSVGEFAPKYRAAKIAPLAD